jgi:hypothetical protein
MVWSTMWIVDGIELGFVITGEVLRKGSMKFALHTAPLDALLDQ